MTQQHEPLFDRAEQERREEHDALPTREELWDQYIDGTLSLDQWAEVMNALYPLSKAEVARLLGRVHFYDPND